MVKGIIEATKEEFDFLRNKTPGFTVKYPCITEVKIRHRLGGDRDATADEIGASPSFIKKRLLNLGCSKVGKFTIKNESGFVMINCTHKLVVFYDQRLFQDNINRDIEIECVVGLGKPKTECYSYYQMNKGKYRMEFRSEETYKIAIKAFMDFQDGFIEEYIDIRNNISIVDNILGTSILPKQVQYSSLPTPDSSPKSSPKLM
jgi:hypothetical protein